MAKPGESYETYEKVKLLGEGSFGKAYLVKAKSDGSLCVIKQVDVSRMSKQEKDDTIKEAKILEALDHPNIIRFREVYTTKRGKLCIVMDYADGGDIQEKIKERRGRYMDESLILEWFAQVCLAMKHVHDRKILHRDLKTQNVFLTRGGVVKLGDFGIARVLNSTRQNARTVVGTPYYLSPQIVQNRPYSFASDIWSLGVFLYELCALRPPFDANSIHGLGQKIVKGTFSPIPNSYSRDLKSLVHQLLQTDPNRRPTINRLLRNGIITSRIKKALEPEVYEDEFSHTILHKQKLFDRNMVPQNIVTPYKKEIEKKKQREDPKPEKEIREVVKQAVVERENRPSSQKGNVKYGMGGVPQQKKENFHYQRNVGMPQPYAYQRQEAPKPREPLPRQNRSPHRVQDIRANPTPRAAEQKPAPAAIARAYAPLGAAAPRPVEQKQTPLSGRGAEPRAIPSSALAPYDPRPKVQKQEQLSYGKVEQKVKEEKKEKPQPNFFVKDYKPYTYEEVKKEEVKRAPVEPKDNVRDAVMAAAAAAKAVERLGEPKPVQQLPPAPIQRKPDPPPLYSAVSEVNKPAPAPMNFQVQGSKVKGRVEEESKQKVEEKPLKAEVKVVDKKRETKGEEERKLWRKQREEEREQRKKDMKKQMNRKGWKKKNDFNVEFIGVAKNMAQIEKKREGGYAGGGGVNNTVLEEDDQLISDEEEDKKSAPGDLLHQEQKKEVVQDDKDKADRMKIYEELQNLSIHEGSSIYEEEEVSDPSTEMTDPPVGQLESRNIDRDDDILDDESPSQKPREEGFGSKAVIDRLQFSGYGCAEVEEKQQQNLTMLLEHYLGDKVFGAFDIVRAYGDKILEEGNKEKAKEELKKFLKEEDVEKYLSTLITAQLLIEHEDN